jgi:CHAD domain-containing protein
MRPNWDSNASAYAAGILSKHLQALLVEMDGVRQAHDIEYIHRMRVASRRLRNALEIFSFCFSSKTITHWQKQVRNVTVSLGKARDRDVQIAVVQNILDEIEDNTLKPGLKRLLLRLNQNRSKLQTKLEQLVDEMEANQEIASIQSVITAMGQIDATQPLHSTALYQLSWEIILKRLQDLTAYEIYIDDLENAEELHAMRIAAKKLRYSLEVFAPLYPQELKAYLQTCRQTQDLLGGIHDCEVWISYLPEFISQEKVRIIKFYGAPRSFKALSAGIDYFVDVKTQERSQLHQTFLEAWQTWQTQNIWLDLTNTIKAPLFYKIAE